MKRIVIFVLIFFLGGVSGIGVQNATSGAADRARIAALEGELKSRNDKLDKCTDALINLHTNVPQPTPSNSNKPTMKELSSLGSFQQRVSIGD
ncbi:MAG: hypothetical protein WA628_03535 [Terriglobales bacterium]